MAILNSGLAKSSAADAYTIDNSLRFNPGDSPYFSRTFSAGNRRTWTLSCWAKHSPGYASNIFGAGPTPGTNLFNDIYFGSNDKITSYLYTGSVIWVVSTEAVFRDPAAWYHIVFAVDTTQDSETDRLNLYVNGELQAFSSATYPPEDTEGYINDDIEHRISQYFGGGQAMWMDGYLAEYYFIDGTQLAASDFGELNTTTNQWIPLDSDDVKDAVTFGTNGFYLDFADSADLGDDDSGEGNDWTVHNLDANDQMPDTPTNNFSTISPLYNGNFTYTEGNLDIAGPQGSTGGAYSTIAQDSGKWYFEMLYSGDLKWRAGIAPTESGANGASGNYGTIIEPNTWIYNFFTGASAQDISGTTISTDDLIGVAFNMDDNEVDFYVNNVQVGSTASLGTPTTPWGAYFMNYSTSGDADPTYRVNFGQDSSFAGVKTAQGNQDSNEKGDFYYTPPTDYLALCTDNLSAPEIALPGENFNTVLYTGTGSELAITGAGFQPDWTWIKTRTLTYNHRVFDSVRGATKEVYTNVTNAEVTDAESLKSFDTDGFTLGTGSGSNPVSTMVSWNWKAGGAPTEDNSAGAGATPTAGSVKIDGSNLGSALAGTIAATRLSANTETGFSIIKFTGNETSGATIAHGLSVAPQLVIVKNLDTASTNWPTGYTGGESGFIRPQFLNTTAAKLGGDDLSIWNSTVPSATVITLGDGDETNKAVGMIAYAFHSVEGYSKFSNYKGNGDADGTFLYCGFRPAYILIKNVDEIEGWYIMDDKRLEYNFTANPLQAQANVAEAETDLIDIVSNGVKIRGTDSAVNTDNDTYLYLAFAESPFKYSNAR